MAGQSLLARDGHRRGRWNRRPDHPGRPQVRVQARQAGQQARRRGGASPHRRHPLYRVLVGRAAGSSRRPLEGGLVPAGLPLRPRIFARIRRRNPGLRPVSRQEDPLLPRSRIYRVFPLLETVAPRVGTDEYLPSLPETQGLARPDRHRNIPCVRRSERRELHAETAPRSGRLHPLRQMPGCMPGFQYRQAAVAEAVYPGFEDPLAGAAPGGAENHCRGRPVRAGYAGKRHNRQIPGHRNIMGVHNLPGLPGSLPGARRAYSENRRHEAFSRSHGK